MPTDFLLPAFALTLLANAVLVAVAVRGLLRARAERDRQDEANRARLAARPVALAVPRPLRVRPPIVESTRAATDPPEPEPTTKRARRPRSTKKAPEAAPKPQTRRRSADGNGPRAETRRGGRRRFSLPPLDEDQDRVNRSIQTFLSGSDNGDAGEAGPESTTVATTVAIVAIDGLDAGPSVADRNAIDGVVATVERTLRAAARSADQVTPIGAGRFRIVLSATGELAARAYLRRVRATVEPSLEAADARLALVTATATVLDDSVPVAVAQAEARLDAALASAARRPSGDESRAAAD